MSMKVNKWRFAISMLTMSLIGIWIMFSCPISLDGHLEKAYWAIFGLHIVMQIMIVISVSRQEADLFEPIMLVMLLYYCIFVYRPIIDIHNGDYMTFGVDPMSACPKSCVIVASSLISFWFAYYSGNKKQEPIEISKRVLLGQSQILVKAYAVWIVAFAASVLNLVVSGKSLSYIFSLSLSGTIEDSADTGIAALSFFSYTMIAPWLYILIYDRGRTKKMIITFLMLCVYVIRGTRITLLSMAAAVVLYFYLSRKRRPKFRSVIIAVIAMLFVMSFLQAARHGIRFGDSASFSWEDFSTSMFTNVFDADLTTYKQFYAIVDAYPSKYPYTMGRAIIMQTLITMIPRAIWPGKPDVVISEVIKNAVNQSAADSGMASPNIGEYYFEFGVLGCVVLMFIVGKIFKHWKSYIASNKLEKIIAYSCLYGVVFQLIIRTSTPSLVYQYIFTIVPILLIERINIKQKKYEIEELTNGTH